MLVLLIPFMAVMRVLHEDHVENKPGYPNYVAPEPKVVDGSEYHSGHHEVHEVHDRRWRRRGRRRR